MKTLRDFWKVKVKVIVHDPQYCRIKIYWQTIYTSDIEDAAIVEAYHEATRTNRFFDNVAVERFDGSDRRYVGRDELGRLRLWRM